MASSVKQYQGGCKRPQVQRAPSWVCWMWSVERRTPWAAVCLTFCCLCYSLFWNGDSGVLLRRVEKIAELCLVKGFEILRWKVFPNNYPHTLFSRSAFLPGSSNCLIKIISLILTASLWWLLSPGLIAGIWAKEGRWRGQGDPAGRW